MKNILDLTEIHVRPTVEDAGDDFDVAFGIQERLINKSILSVFSGFYPMYFNDHMNFPDANLSLQWNIKKAPSFAFLDSAAAQKDFAGFCAEGLNALREDTDCMDEADELLKNIARNLMDAAKPVGVEMKIPEIALTVRKTGEKPETRSLTLSASLSCFINLDEHAVLTITPFAGRIAEKHQLVEALRALMPTPSAGISQESDPVKELALLIINEVLLPFLITSCKNLIPQIKIPKLEYEGIQLQRISIGIEEHCLLVKSFLNSTNSSGTAESKPAAKWPQSDFFIVLNNHAIEVVTQGVLPLIRKNLHNGEVKGSYYTFQYDFDLDAPKVSLENTDIKIKMGIKGTVSVTLRFWFFSITIQAFISTKSPAEVYIKPEIKDGTVYAKIKSCSKLDLNISFYNPGILSYLLNAIKDVILLVCPNAITLALSAVLDNMPIISLPALDFKGFGMGIQVTFQKTNIHIADSKLLVSGDINLQAKKDQKDRLAAPDKLKPGEMLLSANGYYALVYQNDGAIEIIRVLDGTVVWHPEPNVGKKETAGCLVMQRDGNLVAYNTADEKSPYWASKKYEPAKKDGFYVVMESNGTLVIYDNDVPYNYVK